MEHLHKKVMIMYDDGVLSTGNDCKTEYIIFVYTKRILHLTP